MYMCVYIYTRMYECVMHDMYSIYDMLVDKGRNDRETSWTDLLCASVGGAGSPNFFDVLALVADAQITLCTPLPSLENDDDPAFRALLFRLTRLPESVSTPNVRCDGNGSKLDRVTHVCIIYIYTRVFRVIE